VQSQSDSYRLLRQTEIPPQKSHRRSTYEAKPWRRGLCTIMHVFKPIRAHICASVNSFSPPDPAFLTQLYGSHQLD